MRGGGIIKNKREKVKINIYCHDNQYEFGSFGIQSLQELKKYQVDVLGNITEVRQEKRRGFH